ncbi:hypothetical protein MYU51_018281 [Penicillium brevicompactum]|uniref:uncharacterized protein n=1 Tax=Penicillium brevicompactum TaxID=5074 RepID=UPI0025404650|nr:uncharacterized protein N7506_007698 [Penicillium brevicompactum]KAJ5333915.1 hypothetical protein N7506_007698 [Penicillium brevicompactum]
MSDWQEEWAFIPFFETIITTSLLIGRLRFDNWPYDFISDGDIKTGRRPSERGRYSAQVGEKKASRNAPYKGFQVGQLLAMPDDLLAPMDRSSDHGESEEEFEPITPHVHRHCDQGEEEYEPSPRSTAHLSHTLMDKKNKRLAEDDLHQTTVKRINKHVQKVSRNMTDTQLGTAGPRKQVTSMAKTHDQIIPN